LIVTVIFPETTGGLNGKWSASPSTSCATATVKACDRTNYPAGDLQRIFHVFLDDRSKTDCRQGSPHLTELAGNSFNAFEA
jgi:hypothetical protein